MSSSFQQASRPEIILHRIRLPRPGLGLPTRDQPLRSIPAVEITGAVYPPLDNIESVCDDLLQVVPNSCFSWTEKKMMPVPEICASLVTSASRTAMENLMTITNTHDSSGVKSSCESMGTEEIPTITTDDSDEDSNRDLGEFLLDAVQWL